MRDDIHNRAPISAALRAVLKQALRPADQQRPDRLRDAAIKAVARELEANIAPQLLDTFRREIEQGDLFGPSDLSAACKSRLDADVVDHLKSNAQATMRDAFGGALRTHLEGQCLEAEAGMIAAGGNRSAVQAGITAFRLALKSAVPTAVQACIEGAKPIVPDHRVTLSESLPLGKRASTKPQFSAYTYELILDRLAGVAFALSRR